MWKRNQCSYGKIQYNEYLVLKDKNQRQSISQSDQEKSKEGWRRTTIIKLEMKMEKSQQKSQKYKLHKRLLWAIKWMDNIEEMEKNLRKNNSL